MHVYALIDLLKLVASQAIVLHHLSAYGPLADAWDALSPASSDWFYDYGRWAVQIFLVLGGYLGAHSCARAPGSVPWWRRVGRRYLRLAFPLLVALILAIGSAAAARPWLSADFVPGTPSVLQLLVHGLLLQTVVEVPALLSGGWYVAIDFQLFVMLTLLMRLPPPWDRRAVWALMGLSMVWFNADPAWEGWGLYFFVSYGMGATARWLSHAERNPGSVGVFVGLVLAGLAVDFRGRLLLALATALLLGVAARWGTATVGRATPRRITGLARWAACSYPLFLVHFSVLMVGNALYVRWGHADPAHAQALLLACWAASLGLAWVFERWVERPVGRVLG